jgi:starvation-inducible DNA-binding protein
METKQMHPVKSPLAEEARKTTGEVLQGTLVDLIDLSLQAKQAHWNLVGPRFRSIHLQLDEVVATARKHTDIVAERAVTIGVNPDGRSATVARQTELPQLDPGYLQDDKAVAAFIDRYHSIIERIRKRISATEETDLVTQDLLIDVAADLEKQYWMFQAEQ